MKYFYKGNELYKIKPVKGLNYLGFNIQATWRDKSDNNKEKKGYFYFKDLTTSEG